MDNANEKSGKGGPRASNASRKKEWCNAIRVMGFCTDHQQPCSGFGSPGREVKKTEGEGKDPGGGERGE